MIRRRRQAGRSAATGTAGGDTDSLQTDVMRFMSIIALCLMAVFALVQSIPPREPDTSAQLEDMDRRLEQGRQALAEIEQVSMQKQQSLDELRGRLLMTQQQLDKERRAVAAARHKPLQPVVKAVPRPVTMPITKPVTGKRALPEADTAPVTRKPAPPAPVEKAPPDSQGFALRFASAAALDRQVETGSVSLYGMLDQQAWQLSMQAGTPSAAVVSRPEWFHEMSATTVPQHYLHSLKSLAGGPVPSRVVWGVQLPAATRTAIATQLQEQQARGVQGGTLVIQGDGKVSLEQ